MRDLLPITHAAASGVVAKNEVELAINLVFFYAYDV